MNKIDGFSKLHNIQFEQKGIRAWRSYGIGRGKEIPFDQLVSQGQESTCLVITSNFFALKDTRVYKCKEPLAESSDGDHDSELDIFECSEPGCVKSFQTFSELESHLDIGDQIKPRPGSSRFSGSLTLVSRQADSANESYKTSPVVWDFWRILAALSRGFFARPAILKAERALGTSLRRGLYLKLTWSWGRGIKTETEGVQETAVYYSIYDSEEWGSVKFRDNGINVFPGVIPVLIGLLAEYATRLSDLKKIQYGPIKKPPSCWAIKMFLLLLLLLLLLLFYASFPNRLKKGRGGGY